MSKSRIVRSLCLTTLAALLILGLGATPLSAHPPVTKTRRGILPAPPATPLPARLAAAPAKEGGWKTLPGLMPINPLCTSLVHTGKVLIVSGAKNEGGEYVPGQFYAGIWDPRGGPIRLQNLPWQIFCPGLATFSDGRFVLIGATRTDKPESPAIMSGFDPLTEKFRPFDRAPRGRYGRSVLLGDGSVLVSSGGNHAMQTYRFGHGWGEAVPSPPTVLLDAQMHLLPDGNIFVSGPEAKSSLYHPATTTWDEAVAETVRARARKGAASVLLPLGRPKDKAARVMILGGASPATRSCEIIDFANPQPAWRATAPMKLPRTGLQAVLLPSGELLALGGSFLARDASTASLEAEIFDPKRETWRAAGSMTYPRLDHSCALLLPDATVWVAGSNPRELWEEHMEIYTPPYLFATDEKGNSIPAKRPTIAAAPGQVAYGASFAIATPDSGEIREVVFVRPGSSMNSFDSGQRVIALSFTARAGEGELEAIAPARATVAPSGYYMVFLINRAGVPSVAKFVQLLAAPEIP